MLSIIAFGLSCFLGIITAALEVVDSIAQKEKSVLVVDHKVQTDGSKNRQHLSCAQFAQTRLNLPDLWIGRAV